MRIKPSVGLLALLLVACAADDEAPVIDASADAADALDASGMLDARVMLDAARDADQADARDEPDASDTELQCPLGWTRQHVGFAPPCVRDNMECMPLADREMCMRYVYSLESCAQAGGTVVDSAGGDCPGETSILGSIEGDGELSFCCRDIRSCAPQLVQAWGTEPFEPSSYYWDGDGCALFFSADCVGPDCQRLFASESACFEAYAACVGITRTCGVGSGGTCFDDEYCAYAPREACGAGDASATCQPHPASCDDVYDPVCGCDERTYANACEAARADRGLLHLGSCESFDAYCTAPCGFESDEAALAECAAITDRGECLERALDESDASLFPCRWTNDFYVSDCPTP